MNYGFVPDPGERILRVIKRHPITLLPAFAAAGALVILAAAFVVISPSVPDTIPYGKGLVTLIALLFVVIAVIAVLVAVYVFRRNVLIFTSMHLVEAEQIGLFNHRVSQINFARVQDVSGSRVGILQMIFNYGDVIVQSAGEEEKFIFHGVGDPNLVADDALRTRDVCMHTDGTTAPVETVNQPGLSTPAAESDDE